MEYTVWRAALSLLLDLHTGKLGPSAMTPTHSISLAWGLSRTQSWDELITIATSNTDYEPIPRAVEFQCENANPTTVLDGRTCTISVCRMWNNFQ